MSEPRISVATILPRVDHYLDRFTDRRQAIEDLGRRTVGVRRMRAIVEGRQEDVTFDQADAILIGIDEPEAWHRVPELAAIYSTVSLEEIEAEAVAA